MNYKVIFDSCSHKNLQFAGFTFNGKPSSRLCNGLIMSRYAAVTIKKMLETLSNVNNVRIAKFDCTEGEKKSVNAENARLVNTENRFYSA